MGHCKPLKLKPQTYICRSPMFTTCTVQHTVTVTGVCNLVQCIFYNVGPTFMNFVALQLEICSDMAGHRLNMESSPNIGISLPAPRRISQPASTFILLHHHQPTSQPTKQPTSCQKNKKQKPANQPASCQN